MITFPILASFNVMDNLYFELGPQPGYLLQGKLNYPNNYDGVTLPIKTEMESQFDLGATIGFGYFITKNLQISTRYYIGIIENDNLLNFGIGLKLLK